MTLMCLLRPVLDKACLLTVCTFLLIACNGDRPEPAGRSVDAIPVKPIEVQNEPVGPNSALLQWDDVELPQVRGYRVYYGPDPDMYLQLPGQGIEVGRVTSYTIDGLVSGRRYYFAVTTVDQSGNESDFSDQVFKDIP